MRVLDTFAGAGGFSLGFEREGFEIVGASEKDDWAADTFEFNHPGVEVLRGDISNFSDTEILERFERMRPDVILGGPPCQGYSISNRGAGDPKDPRNSLFEEFLRVGRLLEPSVMVMENVTGLLRAKTGSGLLVIDIIKNELSKLGYHVYTNILEATNYGVPQIRKRLFIIASGQPLENPFPKPTHRLGNMLTEPSLFEGFHEGIMNITPTLWDAISDLPLIEAREGSEEMEYDRPAESDYQRSLRGGSEKVYNHKAMRHSARLVERFSSMSWGDSTSDVPDHLKPHARNGNGRKSSKVYDQNNRRMHPFRPCHTIAASFYANFVHPYRNRNFTAREGARIQSFPDSFVFKGKPTVVSRKLLAREGRKAELHLCQYNQIGNAVPPLLASAIAKNLKLQLSFPSSKSQKPARENV